MVQELLHCTTATMFFATQAEDALELASQLNEAEDLRTAAMDILDAAIAAVGAERATLFLSNDSGHEQELSVCMTRGEDHAASMEHLDELFIAVDDTSIAGSVAKRGCSVLVADAYSDSRFNPEMDKQTGFRTKSIVCVPLLGSASSKRSDSGKAVVGVLQTINRFDGTEFDASHMRRLERIATVAGALVQRLRLVLALEEAQQRAGELLVLMRDIPAQAAKDGTRGVVRAIVRTAYRMLNCQRVTLLLVDQATGDLVIQESKDATGVRVPRGKGIAGAVALTGSVINVTDAHEDPRFDAAVDRQTGFRTKSVLAAPIREANGVIAGVLMAINRTYDGSDLAQFTPETSAIEDGAAASGGSVRFRDSRAHSVHHSRRRVSPASRANGGTDSSKPTVRFAGHSADAHRGSARIGPGASVSLVTPTSPPPSPRRRQRSRAAIAAGGGGPVPVPPPVGSSLAAAAEVAEEALAAHVAFPFTPSDERVMDALVGQAGVELSRAAAAKELQRSRDITAALLDVVHASAVEPTLPGLVNRVITATYRLLHVDRVSLFLVDPLRNELFLVNSADAQGLRVAVGEGLAGTAAATGRISNVEDAYASPLFDRSADIETGFRTRSVLTVPVGLPSSHTLAPARAGSSAPAITGAAIAVLQAINKRDGACFDRQDEEAVAAFSVEVALALKRRSVEAALLSLLDEQDDAERLEGASRRLGRGRRGSVVAAPVASRGAGEAESRSVGGTTTEDEDEDDLGAEDVRSVTRMGELESAALSHAATSVTRGAASRESRRSDPSSPLAIDATDSLGESPSSPASSSHSQRPRRATMAVTQPRPGGRIRFRGKAGRRLSSSMIDTSRARLRAREREVAVSLLSYYDDSHASSRLHTSVVLRRMSFTPGHTSSWPEGLIATGAGAGFDPSDPILTWSWDIFKLWDGGTTGGENALKAAVVGMLQQLSLLRRFAVNDKTLQHFVNAVRAKYHENAFHNWRHAVAVMQASFLIMCHTNATAMLTYQDIFACLIAALCHDIDHFGCSNGFLVATSHDLALRHNDDAPLERHHSATAAALLQDPRMDVFQSLQPEERKRVRKVMVGAILATDMSRHFAHVQALSDRAARAVAERQASAIEVNPGSPLPGNGEAGAASAATMSDDAGTTIRPQLPGESCDTDSVVATTGHSGAGTGTGEIAPLMRSASDASVSGHSHNAHKRLTALGRRSSAAVPPSDSEPRGLLRSRLAAAELSPAFDRDDEKDRLFLIESIVHTADLSGQAFPLPVAILWGNGIIAEFQKEAREYAKKGLIPPPFIANLDTLPQQAGCQSGFVSALVLPLWERMQDLLDGLEEPVRNLHSNLMYYEAEAGKVSPDASPSTSDAGDDDALES